MNLGELKDQLAQVSRQDVSNDTAVAVINQETGEIWTLVDVVIERHEDATQRHTVWLGSRER